MNYPQQQYPPQYPQAPAPQAYPPQVQGPYPPQPYAQPVQQPPAQPLAQAQSLDDYFNQPSTGGGPAISWSVNGMPKPEGTTYAGIVARDVTVSDIQQQTDPKTGAPKFYRDGRPQFVMKVPLKVQPSQEFPEGEAVLFVRGQMRDELSRAMGEAGIPAGVAPKAGDAIQVTLVQRKPSRGGGMPMNVFAIRYTAAAGGTGAPSPAPVPQAQPAPQQVQQPVQQQYQQEPSAASFPPVQYQQQAAPQYAAQPAAAPQVPQGQPAPQPAPPSDLTPEQQQLLAQMTGQQA